MTRQAIVKLPCEILAECAGLLTDHGLRIVGALASDRPLTGQIKLLVEGDQLPDACELDPREVVITITTEAYGTQRLRRIISEIRLVTQREAA